MTKAMRGWFDYKGHPGDRSLEQQMVGLEPLRAAVKGLSVLDVGCAEGLIALELCDAGALYVRGIDIIERNVADANANKRKRPAIFECANADTYAPLPRSCDIVLLLAVLHKLRQPVAACARLADAARSLCVIRIGHAGLHFTDVRSDYVPQDIGAAMTELGFELEQQLVGPHGDPTYYFRR